MKWSDALADELHKPIVRKFEKRRVIVSDLDDTWTADLVDMQSFSKYNDGVKYLLMVLDVFSKYGWIVPLKSKTGVCVANAFREIFSYRKPKKLWVDKGSEFYNKDVKKLGVELYSTENEEKSSVIERWNRTIKERMFKYFTANSTYRYIDILDDLLTQYNNAIHSSIKMSPIDASKPENKALVYRNLYGIRLAVTITPKFKVGDKVRISKKKTTFEKGYTSRWTEEIFTVTGVQYTEPVTYKISDMNGEEIHGTFYEKELQKTTQEIFRIEKVIEKRGDKSLVKWFGYPDSFNSWISNKDIFNLK